MGGGGGRKRPLSAFDSDIWMVSLGLQDDAIAISATIRVYEDSHEMDLQLELLVRVLVSGARDGHMESKASQDLPGALGIPNNLPRVAHPDGFAAHCQISKIFHEQAAKEESHD